MLVKRLRARKTPMHDTAIFWFTNDLRLSDHAALQKAALSSKKLLCVYCVDIRVLQRDALSGCLIGAERWRFLRETILQLEQSLRALNQSLYICVGHPAKVLAELIKDVGAQAVYRSYCAGLFENQHWQQLQRAFVSTEFEQIHTHTLFTGRELPFTNGHLPATFSQFCKEVAHLTARPPLAETVYLPPAPEVGRRAERLPPVQGERQSPFGGGWRIGQAHLQAYFSCPLPAPSNRASDALQGWDNSTKLSPWLALGALSPRQVVAQLRAFEDAAGRSESSERIYCQLLWREYFQWHAHCYRKRLFCFSGITDQKPLTSFYAQRYKAWCEGRTPYPLINACMQELNITGFLSHRGRQLTASCLIHELELDWRYGAAYFEQRLIDYDVASNWGNWQHLAGVGLDPTGKQHLDIDEQTQTYDADGTYTEKWQGRRHCLNQDYYDWPQV